jgi:parallel beta-helix repeat protein
MKKVTGFLLALMLSSIVFNAYATTYYLAAPSYNSALQSLVNNAVAGDIITLRAGSHYITTPIRFAVGKNSITVRGENGAIVRKATNSYNASAFEITGNYNTLDNFELDGGNLPEAGIIVYGQRNTVSNCRIHNCGNASAVGAGILLHNSGNPVCSYNTVIGCKVYYNYMVGISQNGHSDGTIRDNQIYENGAEGLTIDIRSHNNYIFNNWIHLNNLVNRGVGGIGIDFSNGNRIISNTIDYTRYKHGICFQNNIGGCDGTTVKDNRINYNDGWGILERWTQYSNTNTGFTNNELTGNKLGRQTIIYSGNSRIVNAATAGTPATLKEKGISISCNPVSESFVLNYHSDTIETRTFQLYNSLSQTVIQKQQQSVIGMNSIVFEMGRLAKGVYYLKIIAGGKIIETLKVYKQ